MFSKSRKDGGLYRLAMADGGANFHLDASFESKRANQGAGDPRFDWAIRRCAMKITVAARMKLPA